MRYLTRLLMILVHLYRIVVSPLIPSRCRFYPTCSAYCLEALREYGALRGLWLTIKRIIRCRPGCPGGFDPVPGTALKRDKWKKTQLSR